VAHLPRIRLLCWVPVRDSSSPEIRIISETWAKDCDKMIFFSERADKKLGLMSYKCSLPPRARARIDTATR